MIKEKYVIQDCVTKMFYSDFSNGYGKENCFSNDWKWILQFDSYDEAIKALGTFQMNEEFKGVYIIDRVFVVE